MALPSALAGARPWFLAGAGAAVLLPGLVAIPICLLALAAWVLTRPRRRQIWIIGLAAVAALALIAGAVRRDHADSEARTELAERARPGYARIWRQLDASAVAAAARLGGPPAGEVDRRRAFETFAQISATGGAAERTLLLTDPDGAAIAWSGPGLLHEPDFSILPAEGRTHIAGFSAVTLLRVVALAGPDRPWRVVAGLSLSADRLPVALAAGGSSELRWTLVAAGDPVKPGLIRIAVEGAPTLLIEPPPGEAAGRRGRWPRGRRLAALVLALGLIAGALEGRPRGWGSSFATGWPPIATALAIAGVAMAVPPSHVAGALLALGWAALSWRRSGRVHIGSGVVWGLLAAALSVAVAFALQLGGGPTDLGEALFPGASELALRVMLAALVFGLVVRAGAGEAPTEQARAESGRGVGHQLWVWTAVLLLLAAAAAHDSWGLGGALLLLGAGLSGGWAAKVGAAGRPMMLAVLGLVASLIAATAWELAYRVALARHLQQVALAQLAPPTVDELEALAEAVRRYLESLDLEVSALQSPDVMDRQDLAYEIWHHSPLATRGLLSALVVGQDEGVLSTFAFGMPLTEEGDLDQSPLRRPEPVLPVWDEVRESDSIVLKSGGTPWGTVRYWLRARPGFRIAGLPLEGLAAGLLRGGPFVRPPGEAVVAPASFALYRADGIPIYTVWGEGPVIGGRLLTGGRGRVTTPAGPATIFTAPGAEGVRALLLPRLGAVEALERVAMATLTVLWLAGLLALIFVLAGGAGQLNAIVKGAVHSYSRRLLVVYGLLLLVPVLLLNLVFVRVMAERLRREQQAKGEAALESAQRVLGDYVLSLETGFVIDTQLDNELLVWLAEVIRHDVNLYWGSTVYVSSKPELFTAGFLPKRIPGEIYTRLLLRSRERASRVNRVGGVDYLELYAPLRVPGISLDRARLFLSVPLLAQQEEVAAEIASLRRRATLVTTALILLMAAIGARLGRGFTEPLMGIVRGTQRIAEGASSLALSPADMELATLAEAIDRMAARIDEGRRRLTREKKLVELMVENINTGVLSLDAQRRVVLHNHVAADLLGVRVGESIEAAVAKRPELAPVREFVAAAGEQPQQSTVRLGEGDEDSREWSLIWAPLPGTGDPAALLVVEDVTEVLRAQRLEAWAEMARIIAHEIKNPLTPIRLSADHMRQVWTERPEEFERVFERCTTNILRQVEELQTIAMEFSTYSRIPRIERRDDDLAALVGEIAEAYRTAPSGSVRVRMAGRPDALTLEFDSRLLGRAVRNLIENAIRASPAGGLVEVSLVTRDGDAVIRVADRGPGVAQELLGKIFDPYFSTHDTGTGLGLPIARRIAEAHGGSVRARNRAGGGLEVSIRLPLSGGRRRAEPPAPAPARQPKPRRSQLR